MNDKKIEELFKSHNPIVKNYRGIDITFWDKDNTFHIKVLGQTYYRDSVKELIKIIDGAFDIMETFKQTQEVGDSNGQ